MVMGYQAYAGNGLLEGLATGLEMRKAYDKMQREKGLASGLKRVAEGDETGWQQVAENSPETYMQKKAQDIQNERLKWDQEHRNDITPYQQAILGMKREEMAQNDISRKLKEQEQALALAKQQEEENKSVENAQAGVNTMQEIADAGNLGRFQDSWWNPARYGGDVQKDQGRLASAIAAVAPRAIAKLKAAGVSGVNTLGEFMTYVGLPQNATSTQIGAAVPLIAKIIGVNNPQEKTGKKQEEKKEQKPKYTIKEIR